MRRRLLFDVENGFYQPARLICTSQTTIAGLLSLTCITVFVCFHITFYDTTVYEVQTQQFPLAPVRPHSVSGNNLNSSPYLLPINSSLFRNSNRTIYAVKTESHSSDLRRRLPQALIVGVRKCGTRALLEMLFLHPKIQKADGEVHFFDRDENYNNGLEWYRQNMPLSYADQVTIEKSPSYFVTPEVPERIRAMNASIRLLLILREPVTRTISDYTQLKLNAASTTPQTKLSSATAQKSFEELVLLPNGEVNSGYRPIAISVYHTNVLQWLEVFPRQQMLVVNGDRLIEDPVSEVRKIETFLGLELKITESNFYFNQTKGFYCLRVKSSERCLHESKGRKHPRVDPLVVSKLRKFFNDHNQKLYDLIGEDMGWPEK